MSEASLEVETHTSSRNICREKATKANGNLHEVPCTTQTDKVVTLVSYHLFCRVDDLRYFRRTKAFTQIPNTIKRQECRQPRKGAMSNERISNHD
jgi:hypothetical protein